MALKQRIERALVRWHAPTHPLKRELFYVKRAHARGQRRLSSVTTYLSSPELAARQDRRELHIMVIEGKLTGDDSARRFALDKLRQRASL